MAAAAAPPPPPPSLFLFLFLFLFPLRCTEATVRQTRNNTSDEQDLATCLASAGVLNFTLYPLDPSDAATSPYFPLLSLSLNNLRFSAPHVPKPYAIVLPARASHVAPAVLCLRSLSISIRLRSGGHSYEGLSYTTSQTLTPTPTPTRTPARFAILDLMNLNRVRVDPGSATAWAESGATLGEIYFAVAAASNGSLAFSGGSCPTVGSGGHVSGGGFGLLSRRFGLAADNILDALLLHPRSGSLLNRTGMGPDPFWALRGGGGSSWGPVLAWRLRLVPVPPRVSYFTVNRPGSARFVAGLIHKWQLVAPNLPDELYLSAFVGAALPESNRTGSLSVTFKCLYLGPRREAARVLNLRFGELGLTGSDWAETSWIESVLFFSGLPRGSTVRDLRDRVLRKKTYFKAKSDYVRAPVAYGDLIRAVDLLSEEPRAYLILDPYGGAMARIRSDAIAFPHRAGNLYAIQYLIEWTAEEDRRSEDYVRWLRRFYAHMERHVSAGPRAAYVNYADLDLGKWTAGIEGRGSGRTNPVEEAREWGERYFLGNYDRLVRAKTTVDPENVFHHEQSIPPFEQDVSSEVSSNKAAVKRQ